MNGIPDDFVSGVFSTVLARASELSFRDEVAMLLEWTGEDSSATLSFFFKGGTPMLSSMDSDSTQSSPASTVGVLRSGIGKGRFCGLWWQATFTAVTASVAL